MARDNVLLVRILADDQTRKGFQQATAGLAAFSAAATVALGAATKQAADFEAGMAEIQTLLGSQATPAIAEMRKELLAASRASGETLQALTKARYDIISAGFTDAAEGANVLSASMDLAKAGMVEVSSAADLLTSALNGMGLSADEADNAANVLFSAVRLGKTTVDELVNALGRVFPTAKVAGVSLEEVSAAMALLTSKGITTNEATTSLNQLLNALAAPTKEASREMAALGITLDNGLGPALASLAEVSEGGLDALKKVVPSIEALKAAAAAGSDIEGFNAALKEVTQNTDGLTAAVDIISDTLSDQMKVLKADMAALGVEIGTALIPLVRTLLDVAQKLAGAFSALSPEMKQAITITTALAAALTGAAAAMGGLALAASAALPALASLGVALAPLAPWLAAGSVAAGGLTVALSRVRSELDQMPNFGASDVIGGATPSLSVRPGQTQEAAEAQAELAAATDAVAQAFEILGERTSTAQFKLEEFLGEAPNDFELLIDALRGAGAEAETVNRVFAAWTESVVEPARQARMEVERLAGSMQDTAIAGDLGGAPDVGLPRPPEEINQFGTALSESFRDVQFAGQELLDGTFRAFGDTMGRVIVQGESFGDAFTEIFTGLKQQIISLIAELLIMRAVMAGLKALASLSGPFGAIGGFLLGQNDGTSFVPRNAASGFAMVPGTPGLDSTPALLSGGEAVLTERQNRFFRRALSMPGRGNESLLQRTRDRRGSESVVVGLESGLLRTEAAEIDARLARISNRKGGRA